MFLSCFLWAAIVYQVLPPAVGVGKSVQDARAYIEALNRFKTENLPEQDTPRIYHGYTVVKRDGYIFCLCGVNLNAGEVDRGIHGLLAEYNKVFESTGHLKKSVAAIEINVE